MQLVRHQTLFELSTSSFPAILVHLSTLDLAYFYQACSVKAISQQVLPLMSCLSLVLCKLEFYGTYPIYVLGRPRLAKMFLFVAYPTTVRSYKYSRYHEADNLRDVSRPSRSG